MYKSSKTNREVRYWLMKSEPSCYSIDRLKSEKVGMWDGVRNYQARNMLRDEIKKGDIVLFYHSNEKPIGIVGEAVVSKEAYPDPTQFNPDAKHYDAKSAHANPRWFAIDIRFKKKYKDIISLSEIKRDPNLNTMVVAKKGCRLSVQPVHRKHYDYISKLNQ